MRRALLPLLFVVSCSTSRHYVGDGVTPGVWVEPAREDSCKKCGLCDDLLVATVCRDGQDGGRGACSTDVVMRIPRLPGPPPLWRKWVEPDGGR